MRRILQDGRLCNLTGKRSSFRDRISTWRRIGDPSVELEHPSTASAKFSGPSGDLLRLHHQNTARTQPAGIGNRNRQRRRARAGHRSEKYGNIDPKAGSESVGALKGTMHDDLLDRHYSSITCYSKR
jgi:hypothetical protein